MSNPDLVKLDPQLEIVVKQVSNLHFTDIFKKPYVALIGSIIGQRIRYTVARQLRSRLYELYGTEFNWVEPERLVFLSSETIQIIQRVNTFLATKDQNFLSRPENIRELTQIPGIGPWTVETTLLSSGLDMDIFPCGDLFLKKRVQRLYKLEKLPTEKELNTLSEKWRPYRGYVAWYLWRWF